ncbi:MAG TPA: hypothetical protein VHW44_17915 [Pseudonocardiaceae bacterium]|jgi:hypothetical protein|nr:hypothetical protein [Pseudonocardiaceae bacterium]
MNYLRGFLPWIVFSVVSSFSWQWAALIALAMSSYALLKDRRAGVTADAQILDFGTIAFFALLTVVAFADPHSVLQTYESGVSSAWLALIAGVSLLVRQPFTLGIAKRSTTPEVWHTARFRHICTVLTSVWASSFAVSAVLTLSCEATDASEPLRVGVQVLGFVVPAAFTQYYVKKVRARAASVATNQVIPAVER